MKRKALLFAVLALTACAKHRSPGERRTLHVAMETDIKGFDPAQAGDLYSHSADVQVYEGLLQYDYLYRPYRLRPLLAEAMPEISPDGLTYTFRLRDGVYFHPDPAFGGGKRKLKASDVVFSFLRIADPHLKSNAWWLFEGKVRGLDDFRRKLVTLTPPVDYAAHPVEGFEAPDDRTFVIHLVRPNRQLLYALAMAPTLVVAPEVVKMYGEELLNHPVGTGPFRLKEWRRGQKIVFERNPDHWEETYPTEGEPEDRKEGLLDAAGKKLPFVDEVVVWIYVESQPRWLNFLRGNLDLGGIPKEAFDTVFDEKFQLKEEIRKKGIEARRSDEPDDVFFGFNLEDRILGKNKFLRQAISCAIDREEKIRLFYNNRAIVAEGIVPPTLFGYDPKLKNPYGYDLARAKALMVKAKEVYRQNGGKGEIPTLIHDITNATVSRQLAESLARDLKKIGVRLEVRVGTWPQFTDRMAKKQVQFFGYAWSADYPDPENFLQLLYSKNVSPGPNHTNFSNAEYDRLYEQMRDLEDGPERKALINRMTKITQEEVPWVLFSHRIGYSLRHAWVRNYKRSVFSPGGYKYIDLDPDQKAKTLPMLQ